MPTAVLDLDLAQLPLIITGLERYDRALILVRLQGRPIGRALLPVASGRIGEAELRDDLIRAVGWPFCTQWLNGYLGWDERPLTQRLPLKATIAVCTRDRTADLRRCLDGLMGLPDDGQEILVIDNCPSTDATQKLVGQYRGVCYVREDRPGLDIARNRALLEAQHSVIAFTDDDAVPDRSWLRALLANFDDPRVLCVTGLTMPLELETKAQEWFEHYGSFEKGFRRVVFDGTQCNPLAVGRVGAGVNMALRRSVLDSIGPFDEALDAGTLTQSGGDHDMFSRILTAGYHIVYDPAALSWHRHRHTWKELRQTLYGYGVGVYAAWTRSLIVAGEVGVMKASLGWFRHEQLPGLARSLLRLPGSMPLDLRVAELHGCVSGPRAYLLSRKRSRSRGAK